MAKAITLLGKRVEAHPDSIGFVEAVWETRRGPLRSWVNGDPKGKCYGTVEIGNLRVGGWHCDSPQAAAYAIERALRDLVNGDWSDAIDYLGGLREDRNEQA